MKKLLGITLAFCAATYAATPVLASTFWGGTITNIASNDTLKIRQWPSATSQIIDAYANGANISMTGRCKNIITNASFQIDGAQSANWKYAKMQKQNVWCQVMTDGAQLGWARGKFIWPQ